MDSLEQLRWLSFESAARELEFRRSYDESALPLARLSGVLAFLLTGAFAGIDALVITKGFGTALLVRGLILIVLALAIWSTYQSWGQRFQRDTTTAAAVATNWGFGMICVIADVPQVYIVLSTSMLIVFLCAMIRPGLKHSLGGSVLMLPPLVWTLAADDPDIGMWVFYLAFTANFFSAGIAAAYLFELSARRTFVAECEAADAIARTESLLRNVLPGEIADRLRVAPKSIADSIDSVSVVFADLVGFTTLAARLKADEVVTMLDNLFSRYDTLCDQHGVEKIKTIGDAYMAVAGAPTRHKDPAAAAADFALALLDVTASFGDGSLNVRVGIHSGPVVAGVIGSRRFAYDLWGDTVNTASRMESHGSPGEIQVSEETFALLEGRYSFDGPRRIVLKGLGERPAYRLLGRTSTNLVRTDQA